VRDFFNHSKNKKGTLVLSHSNVDMQVEALPESKLGTQEYWDDIYDREIGNYDELGDEGEIW
jgi:hypothetical protein